MKRRTAKDRHRDTLLKYLSNPDNEWLPRCQLSTEVLGYKTTTAIYTTFTPEELHEIDAEALEIRRMRYSKALSKIDVALLARAQKADASAILAYQRFEGWVPEVGTKISGELNIKHSLTDRLKRITSGEGADEQSDRKRVAPRLLPAKSA